MNIYTIFKIQVAFFAMVSVLMAMPFFISFLFTPFVIIDCFSERHHSSESFLDINGTDVILPLLAMDFYALAFLGCFVLHNKNLPAHCFHHAVNKKMYWKTIMIILPLAVLSSWFFFVPQGEANKVFVCAGRILAISSSAVVLLNMVLLVHSYSNKENVEKA